MESTVRVRVGGYRNLSCPTVSVALRASITGPLRSSGSSRLPIARLASVVRHSIPILIGNFLSRLSGHRPDHPGMEGRI
jgi:hypothetical protein